MSLATDALICLSFSFFSLFRLNWLAIFEMNVQQNSTTAVLQVAQGVLLELRGIRASLGELVTKRCPLTLRFSCMS